MAIKDDKKDLKLGMTVAEMVGNSDDNFTTLFDNQDDLQTQINGKEPKIATKGTAFNKNFSTANPQMDGAASPGTADNVARGDHRHPTDTTRLAASPDGTNTLLDENNKIRTIYLSDEILGQLAYQGVWDASKNTGYPATTKKKGDYYVCSAGGKYNPDGTAIATDAEAYAVGDWAVYNGTSWDKVDNTDAVTMVNGQIGSVRTYKDAWAPDTTYYRGDMVLYQNILYVYIDATPAANKAITSGSWQPTGKLYQAATTTEQGLMSAADKTNLDANTAARHTHSNKALLDTYNQTNANIKDAVDKKHTHSNKAILDATTASYTEAEKTKLSKIDDSLLDKTFDEFGKVKDVTLNGTSVLDTADGIAKLNLAYSVELVGTTNLTVTAAQYAALKKDPTSYIILHTNANKTETLVLHRVDKIADANLYYAQIPYKSDSDGVYEFRTIAINSGTLKCSYGLHSLQDNAYKLDAMLVERDGKYYPSVKAVADFVANYVTDKVKVTDVQKPDGTSLVSGGIAKIPSLTERRGSTYYATASDAWTTGTINGKTYYGVPVDSRGFVAMANADGESIVCQLKYDFTAKTMKAYIAEKQDVMIIYEETVYA